MEDGNEEPPSTSPSHLRLHVGRGGAVGGCLKEVEGGGGGLRSRGGGVWDFSSGCWRRGG